jgi:hypothetical protein
MKQLRKIAHWVSSIKLALFISLFFLSGVSPTILSPTPAYAQFSDKPAIIPDGAQAEFHWTNFFLALKRWSWILIAIGLVISAVMYMMEKPKYVIGVIIASVILAGGLWVIGLIGESLGG